MSKSVCERPDAAQTMREALDSVEPGRRLTVLAALQVEGRRFDDLQRVTEMDADTLETVLSDLEALGLVDTGIGDTLVSADYRCSQEVTGASCDPDGPDMSTYYSLTAKGEALAPVFEELGKWAADWG